MNTTILVMSDVTIRKAHLLRAYDALLTAAEHNDGKHRFPPRSTIAHAGELKLALGSYGLHFEENAAGALMNLTFRPDRADNTREILSQAFEALGPYVVAGHAAIFASENAEVFRFYFDGTQCVVQEGYAAFTDAPTAPPEVPADRLSEVAQEPRPWITQAGTQNPDEEMGSGMTLRRHAEFGDAALQAYAVRTGLTLPGEYEEAVSDLIGDVQHLCDREGLDFEELIDRAGRRYNEEIEGDG